MKVFGLIAALLFGLVAPAFADTIPDPLHGYIWTGSPPAPSDTDNGTVAPLGGNTATNFGFDVTPPSAGSAAGTLHIDILTPVSAGTPGTFTLTGNVSAGATELLESSLFNTAGQTLASFLGLPSPSPPNKCCDTWGGPSTGPNVGYYVTDITISGVTLNNLANSTMEDSITQSLATGSLILAFMVETSTDPKTGLPVSNTIDTANSGALWAGAPNLAPTPIPGTVWLLGTGLVGLFWSTKKKRSVSVLVG